jgi:hypothetical protein
VSTVPRFQGQGRPPGQATRRGRSMTEASVSFAGNLTDDPEVRSTEGGIARARFRVAVSGVGPMRKNPVVLRQAYPDGRS